MGLTGVKQGQGLNKSLCSTLMSRVWAVSQMRRQTKYEPYEQGSLAPIKSAETFFPALIDACAMALVHGQRALINLQMQGQKILRGGWDASPSLGI